MSFINKILTWARIKSPWIIHFNTGACNACDIEILASLTPTYDLERFGIQLKGTPRHADVMVCSGPVTLQTKDRLLRIYEQMAETQVCSCGRDMRQFGRRLPGMLRGKRRNRYDHTRIRLHTRLPGKTGGYYRRGC